MVGLAPIGIFCIAGGAAATMTIGEFGRLQIYLLLHTLGAVNLVFGALPLIVSFATPFTYWKVLEDSRDALITCFVTGSVFVVIPMLVEAVERLFREHMPDNPEAQGTPSIVLPLAYPFPDLGKLYSLRFIPFAATMR